jgi:hypothetical protein
MNISVYKPSQTRSSKNLLFALYAGILLLSAPLVSLAQCDTFPTQRDWWGVDNVGGIAVADFRNPNNDGSPSFYRISPDSIDPFRLNFNTPGVGLAYSGLIGSQGQVLLNLTSNGLRDSTYNLARGTDSLQLRNRSFPPFRGFQTGSDVQPLILPDPNSSNLARPERAYLFYTEMGQAEDLAADQDSLKALRARYLAIYEIFTGQLSVIDSVFARGLTSATAAIRHPSGDGYWILMSSHVPTSRLLAYRFSSAGLDLTPVESFGEGAGPLPFGPPEAIFLEDLNDVQEYLYFSPTGDRLARVRGPFGGPISFTTPTTIELWEFDANTGLAAYNRDIFRNISGYGGATWSKSGDYFYAEKGATIAGSNARMDSAFLVRRKIDDPALLQVDPLLPPAGDTVSNFVASCTHPLGKGPNGRIYFGTCDILEIRNTDDPSPDTSTVFLDPLNRRGALIHHPTQPILDFTSSRIPRLRLLARANALPCAEQTEVVIPRTAFLDPGDVELELGPGINTLGFRRVGTRGDTLTVTFDASTYAGGQSFILAHHLHPCKTYSDTLHIFSQAPIPTLDTMRICAGDSAFIHNLWRSASTTADTLNFITSLASSARPGCDSVSNVTLITLPHDSLFNTATVMAGDTLSGVVIGQQDTSFIVTLDGAASNGCDLIINYEVFVDTTSSIINLPQRRGPNATLLDIKAVNPMSSSEGLNAWVDAAQGSAGHRAASAGGGCIWSVVRPDGHLVWRGTTSDPKLKLPQASSWSSGLYIVLFSSRDGRSQGQTKVVVVR